MSLGANQMTPAYAYIRVSSVGQATDDRDGLTRQRTAIAAYAEKEKYQIVAEYCDAVSGTNDLEDRQGMYAMFEAIREGDVRTVIIEKLDRLARNLMVQENVVSEFNKYRTTLCSTCEPDLCSSDPSRIFIRQIFGAVAEYDRAMIVAKLKAARQRCRATKPGYREGQRPYGFLESEREVIRTIVSLRQSGLTLGGIVTELTCQSIPTQRGGDWWPSTVLSILKREGLR
jgi:DNA invertase Pin-like site-specific DNA recombinase